MIYPQLSTKYIYRFQCIPVKSKFILVVAWYHCHLVGWMVRNPLSTNQWEKDILDGTTINTNHWFINKPMVSSSFQWRETAVILVHPDAQDIRNIYAGWWYTYPSEKWWSSSVGMMRFPFFLESHKIPWFQPPPTSNLWYPHTFISVPSGKLT